MATVSTTVAVIITGAYPTDTPTVLGATKAIPCSITRLGVEADIRASAATGTIYLLGWNITSLTWMGVISGNVDSTVDGGHVHLSDPDMDRSQYSHWALWEKTAGATYSPVTKGYIIQR